MTTSRRRADERTRSAPAPRSTVDVTRRTLLAGAAGAVAGLAVPERARAQNLPEVPPDPTRIQGTPASALGVRSPFEQPQRNTILAGAVSSTPLEELHGTITPSDLHFERHHGGVPAIDPAHYTLLVHGFVERSTVFTLDDLKRLPSISRILFIECSGNLRRNAPETTRPREIAGLMSQTEWTGVLLSTLFREVGVWPDASWLLAEGQDAAVMTRSMPVEKAWNDVILAYAQNGEALRPANGYPVRLVCPGWEGNMSVKWLRRIELADAPFMTREETSKYTEALRDGSARQFSFVMDARSIITSPCYPQRVRPGLIEVRGLAWSGRGRVARAELSFDDGVTWETAELQQPVLPLAHTRFRHVWRWDGRERTIISRAVDETGYVQPTLRQLIDARGPGSGPYHLNPITGWRLRPDGTVVFRTEDWA